MRKHHPPKDKRLIAAEFHALCHDLHKKDAAIQVGAKWDTSPETVKTIAKRYPVTERTEPIVRHIPQIEAIASEDFEVRISQPTAKETLIPVEGKRLLELLASDIHYPFEDPAAYALFVEVAADVQPDILVLLGDIMDCYAVSAHDKDADRATPSAFKEELIYAKTKLAELRERLPNARIIYKEGNHETRLSRYIRKNASALSTLGCVTIPELLGLSELKIEWIGNDERLRIGRLWHIHGNEIGGSGLSPARAKYQKMQCNFIFGHLHQRDKFRPRAYDGQQHGAYANPCLCILKAEYLHHASNWSNGFTLIDHDVDRTFQVEEIEVIKPSDDAKTAKCNLRGKIYNVDV